MMTLFQGIGIRPVCDRIMRISYWRSECLLQNIDTILLFLQSFNPLIPKMTRLIIFSSGRIVIHYI